MKKILEWIKKYVVTFIKSMVIGATLRVPGMSGGTTAIILGIYDKLLSAVNNFFKNIKENIVFLAVFVLGGGLAFLVFNSLIYKVTSNYPAISAYFFVGIILFGIPALIKESGISYRKRTNSTDGLLLGAGKQDSACEKQSSSSYVSTYDNVCMASGEKNNLAKTKVTAGQNNASFKNTEKEVNSTKQKTLAVQILLDLIPFLCGAAAVVAISLLQQKGLLDGSEYTGIGGYVFNILAGFFAGVALVLPGLSFTYFLTVIGLMDVLSESISLSSINPAFLITFGIGAVIGLVATAKILGSLIEKRKRGTYLCVIGFLIGSVVMLLTDTQYIPAKTQIFFCALFFVLGAALILGATYLASRFAAKRETASVNDTSINN